MSTGAGPFTYYSSLSGGSRSSSARSSGPTKAQLAQAEKERQFLELREILAGIVKIHQYEFPKVEKPTAPPPTYPDEKAFLKEREREQLVGISLLKRGERKAAKERAASLAAQDAAKERQRIAEEHRRAQEDLDAAWQRLLDNDPETVIATVDAAFEDNEAPATPVNVEDDVLSLVVLAPSADEIPERMPDLTPTGKPTTKKMTKAIRADTYLTLVCGHLLATIKEALAEAPNVTSVKGVVVRQADPDVFGKVYMEPLVAASFSRADLARVQWAEATSPEIVRQASQDLLWELKGKAAPELKPLDLDDEPELKRFIDALNEKLLVP